MSELKPCPFCGAVPKIEWESWRETNDRLGVYILSANHKVGCFIRQMDGTNYSGRMTCCIKMRLVEAWNRRTNEI